MRDVPSTEDEAVFSENPRIVDPPPGILELCLSVCHSIAQAFFCGRPGMQGFAFQAAGRNQVWVGSGDSLEFDSCLVRQAVACDDPRWRGVGRRGVGDSLTIVSFLTRGAVARDGPYSRGARLGLGLGGLLLGRAFAAAALVSQLRGLLPSLWAG